MYNSIVNDNRYKNQKQKLLKHFKPENIHYIIEESDNDTVYTH